MSIDPGRLDSKITISTKTFSTVAGERIESWATLGSVWAEVREVKGNEFEQAQQIASETDTKFIIRYSSDVSGISAKDKIVFRNNKYDILEVLKLPGGRPDRMEIYAQWKSASTPESQGIPLSTDFSVAGNLTIKAAAGF